MFTNVIVAYVQLRTRLELELFTLASERRRSIDRSHESKQLNTEISKRKQLNYKHAEFAYERDTMCIGWRPTNSVSGQDELNLALWLATRAGKITLGIMCFRPNFSEALEGRRGGKSPGNEVGKMELSCPLGIRALSRKDNLSCFGVLSHIINPLLTKLVRSRWLDIGLVLFFLRVYGPRLRLGP